MNFTAHLIFKVGDLIQFATSFLFWICLLSFGLFCGVYTIDSGVQSGWSSLKCSRTFPSRVAICCAYCTTSPSCWQGPPDFFVYPHEREVYLVKNVKPSIKPKVIFVHFASASRIWQWRGASEIKSCILIVKPENRKTLCHMKCSYNPKIL